MLPFSVNIESLKVKFSVKSILWCIIFSLTLILVDPYLDEVVYRSLELDINNTGIAARVFARSTHFMILICVYSSILYIKSTFQTVQILKTIFEKLDQFGSDFNLTEPIWKKCLNNFLTIQITIIIIHYVYAIHICNVSILVIIFYAPLTTLTYTIGSAMLLKFNVFLILLQVGFLKINRTIGQMNFSSDTIDELAQIYFKLNEVSVLILRMFSIPILTFLGFFVLLMENQFFNMFMSFVMETRNGIIGVVCLFSFCFIRVIELALVLQDVSKVVQKVIFLCNNYWDFI